MSPDRYGEPTEPPCPYDCRNGWLTGPNSDHPKPCPHCKDHLFAAQAAPDREGTNE